MVNGRELTEQERSQGFTRVVFIRQAGRREGMGFETVDPKTGKTTGQISTPELANRRSPGGRKFRGELFVTIQPRPEVEQSIVRSESKRENVVLAGRERGIERQPGERFSDFKKRVQESGREETGGRPEIRDKEFFVRQIDPVTREPIGEFKPRRELQGFIIPREVTTVQETRVVTPPREGPIIPVSAAGQLALMAKLSNRRTEQFPEELIVVEKSPFEKVIQNFKKQLDIKEIEAIREDRSFFRNVKKTTYATLSAAVTPFTTEKKIKKLAVVGVASVGVGAIIGATGPAAPFIAAGLGAVGGSIFVKRSQKRLAEARFLGPVALREEGARQIVDVGVAATGFRTGTRAGILIGKQIQTAKFNIKTERFQESIPKVPEQLVRGRLARGGILQRGGKEIQTTFDRDLRVITQEQAARTRAISLSRSPLKGPKPPSRIALIGTERGPPILRLETLGRFDTSFFGRVPAQVSRFRFQLARVTNIGIRDPGTQTQLIPQTPPSRIFRTLPPPPKFTQPNVKLTQFTTSTRSSSLDIGKIGARQRLNILREKFIFIDTPAQRFPREQFAAIFGAERAGLIPRVPIKTPTVNIGFITTSRRDRDIKPLTEVKVSNLLIGGQESIQVQISKTIQIQEILPDIKRIPVSNVRFRLDQQRDIDRTTITEQITDTIIIPKPPPPPRTPGRGRDIPFDPIPPIPIIPIIPPFPIPDLEGRTRTKKKKKRRTTGVSRFVPSIVGIERFRRFKITIPKPPKPLTGLKVRGVLRGSVRVRR